MEKMGLYIHIPFCISKCFYCDFNSWDDNWEIVDKYIAYIKKEINMYADKLKDYIIDTIFFGGGTPSAIDGKYIYNILEHVYQNFNVGRELEVTLEGNPKTFDQEKLSIYKSSGINRISLGVQSLNDGILKSIGRIHDSKDVLNTYNAIRKKGFKNVNFDIMFNLPDQKIYDVLETLKKSIEMGVEHISFYSLKIEEGTPFHNMYLKHQIKLPDEDDERRMYHQGIELLKKNGIKQYEISNFAKDGYLCRHNLMYWEIKPYLGIGVGAYSNLFNKRWGNKEKIMDYFNDIDNNMCPISETEYIDYQMEISEYIILGLRLNKGINYDSFFRRFNVDIESLFGNKIEKLKKQGLIVQEGPVLKLTSIGLDFSNIVFGDFLF